MIGVIGLKNKFTIFEFPHIDVFEGGSYEILFSVLSDAEAGALRYRNDFKDLLRTNFSDSYYNRTFIRKLFRSERY